MWFAEGYLRYDKTESQYRMALTLPDDSARAILRNVVKRDAEENEVSNPKYVEALAAIEEVDVVLQRYEEAYRLNPSNSSLIIKYGCRLFLAGAYREARERFREAGIQPPKNALPRYLEAAALAASLGREGDLSEAIALVARTNTSGDPMIFPQPLWHASLPKRGNWYAHRKREIADRCCAPLYRFKDIVVGRADTAIDEGHFQDWDSWLGRLETLGEMLVGGPDTAPENLGAPQAMAGVRIQLDALDQRTRIGTILNGVPQASHLVDAAHLRAALDKLKAFEDFRDARTRQHRRVVARPLYLCAGGLALLLALYCVAYVVGRVVRLRKSAWTVSHTRAGYLVLGAGLIVLLMILFAFRPLQQAEDPEPFLGLLTVLWYGTLGALLAFGLIYPALALASVREVCERVAPPDRVDEVLAAARRGRRIAYASLLRRYSGIVLGGVLCVVCLWAVGHRILTSAYPTQLEFLVTGLQSEEIALVREVQSMLSPPFMKGGTP